MPSKSSQSDRAGRVKKTVRLLIELLVLAVLLPLFFVLAGRALCKIALDQIADMTGTKITDKSVDFHLDGSVVIRDLLIRPESESECNDVILDANTVEARFGIGSLLLLRPRLKKVIVRDFDFNIQQDLNSGQWNLSALKLSPAKGRAGQMPVVNLERGTLKYSKLQDGEVRVIASVPVDASFGPDEKTHDGYSFDIRTAQIPGVGKNTLRGRWQPGVVAITGGVSSAEMPALDRVWTVNVMAGEFRYEPNDNYSLKLNIKDLVGKDRTAEENLVLESGLPTGKSGLFAVLQRFFHRYRPAGRIDLELEASGSLNQLGESKLKGEVLCDGVSICDRRFSYPINGLVGRVDLTESSVKLNNLRGNHNSVELFFNGHFNGFGPERQYEIRITSNNMVLDNDLYNALSPEKKRSWDAFSPTENSIVGTDYRINRRAGTVKKRLTVELLGTEAKYRGFPYPLSNLSGKLIFAGGDVDVSEVVSQVGRRKITLNGKVTSAGTERPMYDITIEADNVPLDSTLSAALPQEQKLLYEQLEASGLIDADIRIFTPDDKFEPTSFIADVSFKKARLKGEQLPFDLSDVTGKAVFTPGLIRINNLRGRCNDGLVTFNGHIRPSQEPKEWGYRLSLNGEQVELSDNLFNTLPGRVKKLVYKLKPRGKVDIDAELNKTAGADYPDYNIAVQCLGNSIDFQGFTYPLKDLTGKVTITEQNIGFKDIIATTADDIQGGPSRPVLKVNGLITLSEDGFGEGLFEIDASDIVLDERLGLALPAKIQPFYQQLAPTGRFDLKSANIKISADDSGEKFVDFAGGLIFKDCGLKTFPPVTELYAELAQIESSFKTGEGFYRGRANLAAESFRVKGAMLKDISAEVVYDKSRKSWRTKDMTADFYSGALAGKFEIEEDAASNQLYTLQIGFDDVGLEEFLRDVASFQNRLGDAEVSSSGQAIASNLSTVGSEDNHSNGYTKGQMSGSLCISKQVGDSDSQTGRCRLLLTDMEVGELSPLAKLLYVFNLTKPKDFAFEKMVVDSFIKGNKLYIDKFDLSGQALAFNGSGLLDLEDWNVDLVLRARGRRLPEASPSVLQSLTEGLGRGVVRLDVTGDVFDPKVEAKPLPVIGATLQILGTKPDSSNK